MTGVLVVADSAAFHRRFYFFGYNCVLNGVLGIAEIAAAAYQHYAGEHETHRERYDDPHRAVGFA